MHRTDGESTAIGGSAQWAAEYDERLSYPVPVASKLVGISARRMWDLVRDRKIKSFMAEGRRLISRKALETYVAEREAAHNNEDAA